MSISAMDWRPVQVNSASRLMAGDKHQPPMILLMIDSIHNGRMDTLKCIKMKFLVVFCVN